MGGGVLVVGLGVATVLVASFVAGFIAPVTRFTTATPLERHLPAGAERAIYRDARPPVAAYREGDDRFGPRLSCRVVEVATGASVPTRGGGAFTLTLNDEEWRSVASFEVERAGRYQVSCSSGSSVPVRLALGPRVRIFRGVAHVLGAIASAVVGLALAAVIIAVTAVRRRNHRLQLEATASGSGTGTV